MNSELHIIVIWEKGRFVQDKIIRYLKKHFIISNVYEIEWSKELFSENLSRFYGESLPNTSAKMKRIGNDKFLLVVLKDKHPVYKYRRTTSGSKVVNINMFDTKELFRHWCSGDKVHGSNNIFETTHDLTMLLGLNTSDYLKTNLEHQFLLLINQLKLNI